MPPVSINLVEDDVSSCRAIERLLRANGFTVESFSSAEEFLASRPAVLPNCLIFDVQLPGISGFDLLSQLAQTTPGISAVFVSAHDGETFKDRMARFPGSVFLRKPVESVDLIAAVRAQNERNTPPSTC